MKTEERWGELDSTVLQRLVNLYHLEQYLFEAVDGASDRFAREQTLAPYDFFATIVWKSNRSKGRVKKGFSDAGKSPTELMREVSRANTARAKVQTLVQIPGIGLAIASALLAVCYPDEFTVLDVRAWTSLKLASVHGLPSGFPETPEEYLQYCQVCKRLAAGKEMSLRDLDRALWAKSWEDDLRRLIDGL